MAEQLTAPVSRRRLLAMIGTAAGSSAMYQAMTTLGLAAESTYNGPIRLEGDPKGASVLILGAGVAGLVAALELHKIGYKVQVLEYNDRAGGRCWTLRGGDRFTELGDFEQTCGFDRGLYFNRDPGGFPITIAASSTTAGAWASASNRSSRSTTTLICTPRMPLVASRNVCATYCPTSTAVWPSCSPRR
jgi:Flavin containing amine oxidoreductase